MEDESKGIAGKPRAEDIAPCRNRGTAAARSGRAPRRRSARARRGCAPPVAASAAACAGPGFCVLACLASEDRRAGSETTVEVDHAEAADVAEFRILYLALLRLAGSSAEALLRV